ncbi:DUF2188 domain-containing protein [Thalassobacillus pellis]|uniref:DUF2188 domain-containing protein n=1 Tax=Thalassobacillus pellis TaxID=748008 RepID=UPI001961F785|nr:DUF2188 domain-containing protein [Thalassobacillus pellis]MBM7553656.1 uncharacterized protein YdaT [Thalassobacillus pellis]
MPWDKKDYPSSLKNLNEATRNKAIDIANAMLDEGYDENRAIPIATSQAKEWYENASNKEREEMKDTSNKDLKERDEEDEQYENRPELLDRGEHVVAHDDGWAVQAKGAKKPDKVFENKQDAIDRAKEVAENKGTKAVIHKKNGDVQDEYTYNS